MAVPVTPSEPPERPGEYFDGRICVAHRGRIERVESALIEIKGDVDRLADRVGSLDTNVGMLVVEMRHDRWQRRHDAKSADAERQRIMSIAADALEVARRGDAAINARHTVWASIRAWVSPAIALVCLVGAAVAYGKDFLRWWIMHE